MQKIRRHIIIGLGIIFGLFALSFLSLIFYLNTDHAQALGQRYINRNLPGTIAWHKLDLALFRGKIACRNFRLKGPGDEELVVLDSLTLNWSWRDLIRGQLAIEARIASPRVHLRLNNDGRLNLAEALTTPRPPAAKDEKTNPLPLNLVVKSLALTDGALWFEADSDRTVFNIHGIDLMVQGNLAKKNGGLQLSFAGGNLTLQDFQTVLKPSSLSGQFANNRLTSIQLSVATTTGEATLAGSIDNPFESPVCDLHVRAWAALENITTGIVPADLKGTVKTAINIKGSLDNPNADLQLSYKGKTIRGQSVDHLEARAGLSNRLLTISQLTVTSGTGQVTFNGQTDLKPVFPNGFSSPHPDFTAATLDGDLIIQAPDLAASLTPLGVKDVKGALGATGKITGTIAHPQLDVQIDGENLEYGEIRLGSVGMTAALDNQGKLRIESLTIDNQGSAIKGKGDILVLDSAKRLETNPPLSLSLTLTDVEARDFVDQELAQGYLNGTVALGGSLKAPRIRLNLNGRDIRFRDIILGDVTAALTYQDGGLLVESVELTKGPTVAKISGSARIIDPATLKIKTNPELDLAVTGKDVHLADYLPNWRGQVSVDARLKGPLKDCHGPIRLSGSDIVSPWQSLEQLELSAFIEGDILKVEELSLSPAPDEWVRLTGRLSLRHMDDVHISSDGITIAHIDWLKEKVPIEGKLAVSLKGNGPFSNPTANGTVALKGVTVDQKPLDDLQGNIGIADFMTSFDLNHGAMNVTGTYHLSQKLLSASALINAEDLTPYFALFNLPDLAGRVQGKFNIEGNPGNLNKLTISGTLADARLDFKGQKMVQTQDIQLTYENGRFNIPGWELTLLDKGRIYIEGAGRLGIDMDLTIEGNLPLAVGRILSPALYDLSGDLKLSATAKGAWAQPKIRGDLTLASGTLTLPAWGGKLHGITGKAILQPHAITISSLEGKLDDGRFRLDGRLALDHFRPGELTLALSANRLPIRIPDKLDVFISSRLNMEGLPNRTELKGNIDLLDGVYYQDLLLNPMDMLKPKTKRPVEPKKPGITFPYLKNLSLDVAVSSRNPFMVENNIAELEIVSDVHIQGKLNRPEITGQTDIAEGTIRLWNRQFQVTRGIIDYGDPYSLRPGIDVRAETDIRQWKIQIDLTGSVDNLQIKLSSNPSEQSGDILALILTGRTSREMAAGESGKAGTTGAALAALAGTPLGEQLKKAARIDSLEVDSVTEGEEDGERTRVTLGKNLSDRMTLKYRMETKEGELVQKTIAEYQLLENILVSGFQDSNGIYGGALRYRIEFR